MSSFAVALRLTWTVQDVLKLRRDQHSGMEQVRNGSGEE
jgi:hypothetical protein